MKPKLFIGSSAESIDIAHAAQLNLRHTAEVTVWDQGVFQLSSTAVESLLDVLGNSDFGMFVFSPDDLATIRGKDCPTVRDNVLFELGLFLGRLGRKRCFILVPEGETDLRMATDLVGVTPGTYETGRRDGNLQSATGPACSAIRTAIDKVGVRFSDLEAPGVVPQPAEKRMESSTEAQEQAESSSGDDVEYTWINAFLKREYAAAAKILEERLSSAPQADLPFLQGWFGRMKYELDPHEGIAYLEGLILDDPKNPRRYTDLAYAYSGSDLYADAISVIDRGLESIPIEASLVLAKVQCLGELGRSEEVVASLEAAIKEHSTKAELYLPLGKHHVEQGNFFMARTCLERGIGQLPNNPDLLLSYAELLRDHFDKKLSVVPFEKLVRLKPEDPTYRTHRGNILLELEFSDMAMRDYQRASELAEEKQGWILGNIGNLYNNRGLYGDAIQYLKKALEQDPDSQYAHERLASAMQLSEKEKGKFSDLLKESRLELHKATSPGSAIEVKAEPNIPAEVVTASL